MPNIYTEIDISDDAPVLEHVHSTNNPYAAVHLANKVEHVLASTQSTLISSSVHSLANNAGKIIAPQKAWRLKPTSSEASTLGLSAAFGSLPIVMGSFFANMAGAATIHIPPVTTEFEQTSLCGIIGTGLSFVLLAPPIMWFYFLLSTNLNSDSALKKLASTYNEAKPYQKTMATVGSYVVFAEIYHLIGNLIGFGITTHFYPSSELTLKDEVAASAIGISYFMGLLVVLSTLATVLQCSTPQDEKLQDKSSQNDDDRHPQP